MKYGKQSTLRYVGGVWPEFGDMRNVIPAEGSRFINERDVAERRRVIFLGDRLKKDLFDTEEAVGRRILVNGTPFTVIGVMKEKEFLQQIRDLARAYGWLEYHPYDSRKSTPGFPDLTMVRDGRLIFAELKVGSKGLTEPQIQWIAELDEVKGCEVYIWRPEDYEKIKEVLSA